MYHIQVTFASLVGNMCHEYYVRYRKFSIYEAFVFHRYKQ